MKRIFFTLLIFVFAQNVIGQGINFQGVARSANGTILASQKISLKLSIITGSNTSTPDYIETRSIATNAQGIFSVVVGDTGAISTIGTYATISWKTSSKFLKVEMDPNNGINFISMGTTPLQYVPFSYYSNGVDAANVAGILPVKSGGTGVASISDLKVALVLDKVNNTADIDKPISALTKTALDLKLNAADTSKYTKQAYTDSALLTKLNTTGNAATATSATTAGTASTATKLATSRNINGIAFDGSGDITVTADAGTLTGTTLKSTVTGSSLTSVGTIASLTTGAITNSGKVIVGASSAASSSAILEASSTTQGFLPPRMTKVQRDAIASPTAGLMIWCSNCNRLGELQIYDGESWTLTDGTPSNGVYGLDKIGDNFQGGKLAYILKSGDPGYDANTPHGLIAATSDQSSGIQWFNGSYTTTGASGMSIGTGLSNTNKIINNQGATATSYAAGLARAYTGGGYTDWYLPSQNELNKLYENKTAIGDFPEAAAYWSSTEVDFEWAYSQNFNTGVRTYRDKNAAYKVRAIRTF